MINFTDKQNLEITAARCVGLIRTLYNEKAYTFGDANAQELLETEYVSLYRQLQDLCFTKKGEIRWMLPLTMEKLPGIQVYKTDLGIGISLYDNMRLEVASKIEARRPGIGEVYEFPSVIRNKVRTAA